MADPLRYNPDDAFHGPLGEYARRSADHIEVDHFTLYMQLLVMFGSLIGRRRTCQGGDSPHFPNLFLAVVADTGQGKGCIGNRAEQFVQAVDPEFRSIVHRDVQSAPALIRLVADEQRKTVLRRGKTSLPADVIVAPAVTDKRCLLIQSEMQTIFTAKGRQGCTLGSLLKQAWDGVTLENNTKEGSLRATDPHISMLGSITPQELRQAVAASKIDRENGFFNRFLFVRPRTVRYLPHGGDRTITEDLTGPLRRALNAMGPAVPPAMASSLMEFDTQASRDWEPFYYAYRDHTDPFFNGLQGFQQRLGPTTKRIAMILAALDGADSISAVHLNAARTACLRCLDDCRAIFATREDQLVTPVGKIKSKLRTKFRGKNGWFDKQAIWDSLGHHGKAEDINTCLEELVAAGEWQRSVEDGKSYRVVHAPLHSEEQPTVPRPTALAKEAELTAIPPPAIADDDVAFNGHRLKLGEMFTVPRLTDALDMDDRPTYVPQGASGRLVQSATDSPQEDWEWLNQQFQKKPHHRLVWIEGRLLRLPIKPVTEWAIQQSEAAA